LAERQELPSERCAAVCRLPDLLYILAAHMLFRQVSQQQVAEAADGREQVVEVMGHTAGKAAGRIHALRLPKLFFTLMQGSPRAGALRDVGAQNQPRPAAIELHLVRDQLHVYDGTVFPLVLSQRNVSPLAAAPLEAMMEAGRIFRRKNVHNGHAQELVP
jgi:hypothetical protein